MSSSRMKFFDLFLLSRNCGRSGVKKNCCFFILLKVNSFYVFILCGFCILDQKAVLQYVFGPLDPLVRGPDPDPSIMKQIYK
jgi:hypothetical protein